MLSAKPIINPSIKELEATFSISSTKVLHSTCKNLHKLLGPDLN